MGETFSLVSLGRVRSAFPRPDAAPIQGRDAGAEAFIEVAAPFVDALEGIEDNDRLVVTCWLHLAHRDRLKVHPRGDRSSPPRGVFATRSPHRPNPLAIYTVDLLEVRGTSLRVRGVDAVDGTPVVDIRPHRPRLDD